MIRAFRQTIPEGHCGVRVGGIISKRMPGRSPGAPLPENHGVTYLIWEMTETEMRNGKSFQPLRFLGDDVKRRNPPGLTAGAAAAIGALAGCGSDGGGGGTGTGGETGIFANGAFTGTSGNDDINEVSRGMDLRTVDAGAGNDTVNTGEGNQTITGGVGDDTIDGGDGVDTAVFAGSVAGYHVTATMDGTDVSFTVDDINPDANSDDGTDTLRGIEMLRFGADSIAVVKHDATDRTGANAEIILGDATPNGAGTEMFDGDGGDDLMFGFRGADVMVGGAGDDRMFGGVDSDTLTGGAGDDTIDGGTGEEDVAVYSGVRAEYLVWRVGGENDDPGRYFVLHQSDAAGNEGRDILTNVELIQFGSAAPVALNDDFAVDEAGIVVADNAPTGSAEFDAGEAITAIDVSAWFDSADESTVTYSVMGDLPDGVTFMGNRLGGVAPTRTTTITIVASNLDGGAYDDVSHEYVINVEVGNGGGGTDGDSIPIGDLKVDRVAGGPLADVLNGGGGDQRIIGNGGNDTIDGGEGEDTAVYSRARSTYTVTEVRGATTTYLVADSSTGATSEGTDTLSNVENLRFGGANGTNVAIAVAVNNIRGHSTSESDLVGNAGDNTIEGGGGGDVITAGLGDDTIHGFLVMPATGATEAATDVDTVAYVGNRDGFTVTATLAATGEAAPVVTVMDTATTGNGESDEGTDTLTSIEVLRFNSGGMMSEQVNVDLVFGDNTAEATLEGGANAEIIFGFGGDDTITGGAGDDTIDGGTGDDTAVFAGPVSGYGVSAALSGDVLELTVVDDDDSEGGDDGADTLIAVETVRFGTADIAVVRHDTDDGERTAADAEILAGDDTVNGVASDRFDGGAGDDMIFGFGGDDHLEGGLGHDTIDGGDGTDTVYFMGDRGDYRIWQNGTGATRMTFVQDLSTTENGGYEGRTTLVGVERVVFGSATAVDVDATLVGTDNAPPASPMVVMAGANPAPRTVDYSIAMTTNASEWFSGAVNDTTYSLAGSTDYTIDAMSGVITHPTAAPAAAVSVTVTASVVDNADFDDVTHTVMFIASNTRGTDDGDMITDVDVSGSENSTIEGLAGDDVIQGRAGDDTLYGNSRSEFGGVGEMDEAVYAGAVEDYAISAGLFEFMSTPAAPNTPRIFIEDDDEVAPAAPAVSNEGRDTLVGFEVIRFLHGTPNDRDDDDVLRVFGMEADDTVRTSALMMEAEILLGTVAGNGESGNEIDGAAGADHMFGFAGEDFLSGGAGDDTITGGIGDDTVDGGMGDDTAVFAGEIAGYSVTAALSGVVLELTVVDDDAAEDGDEGTDSLISVETVRFGTVDMAVVRHDTADEDRNADNAEILAGDDTSNGSDSERFNGGAGDDMIFGLGGDDHLEGGPGNDIIDGGTGTDTVSFAGNIEDYLILEGDSGEFDLIDGIDGGSDGANEGRNTLIGVEKFLFGDGEEILSSNIHVDAEGTADLINGGIETDVFIKNKNGSEQDEFLGGDGADILFITSPNPGKVVFFDFDPAEGDRIVFRDIPELRNINQGSSGSGFNTEFSSEDPNFQLLVDRREVQTLVEGEHYFYIDVESGDDSGSSSNSGRAQRKREIAEFGGGEEGSRSDGIVSGAPNSTVTGFSVDEYEAGIASGIPDGPAAPAADRHDFMSGTETPEGVMTPLPGCDDYFFSHGLI